MMLAESIAGSEAAFVERMNETAKKLGMSRTNFANPNGLPSNDQVSTARDLAKLARAIVTEYPEYARYFAMVQMRYGKNRLVSHNPLLNSVSGADGLKTGFTCDSGFNIVASATRDGRQLVAVVLGDATSNERNTRAAGLLEFGFQQQAWGQLLNTKTLENMPVTPTAEGVTSVRTSVESWSCNPKQAHGQGEASSQAPRGRGVGGQGRSSKARDHRQPADDAGQCRRHGTVGSLNSVIA